MINIIVLFIYLSIKKGLIKYPSNISIYLVFFAPIILSILYMSRTEFIVSIFYSFCNYNILSSIQKRKIFNFSVGFSFLILFFVLYKFETLSPRFQQSLNRVQSITNILSNAMDNYDIYESRNQGITRPLLTFERAIERFRYSPIFGSGFSSMS